ncbi:hypothetical protein ACFLTZ_06820 [Chloroflexota bacterium]
MNYDRILTKEIGELVAMEKADFFGVTPIERLENAPQGYRAEEYLPGAASVISIGVTLANGVCDVWGEASEAGKSISPYLFYGYGLLNLQMGRVANLVAKELERKGYQSLTFPPTWLISFYKWFARRDGSLKGDFSHRHAAVAAGLGEFGWSGLVLVPNHGPRVRFNSIITNAPLVPSPLYDGPRLCQPNKCAYQCVRECPTQALALYKDYKECDIDGKHFKYVHSDIIRCQYGIMALVKGSGSFGHREIPPGPGNMKDLRDAVAEMHPVDKAMIENGFGIICGDFCGRCLHQCPAPSYEKITKTNFRKL